MDKYVRCHCCDSAVTIDQVQKTEIQTEGTNMMIYACPVCGCYVMSKIFSGVAE